jgi:hypothetical protein
LVKISLMLSLMYINALALKDCNRFFLSFQLGLIRIPFFL